MDTGQIKPLISEKISKPLWLIWAMLLPQAVLLWINLSSWSLVKGEMSADQKQMAFVVFGFELALLALGLALFITLSFLKKQINLIICGLLCLAHIAYLWLTTDWWHKMLPSSVVVWILPPDEVVFYQYLLMVPVIFYTGLRLACFRSPINKVADISVSVAVLIMVPLVTYFFTTILHSLFRELDIPSAVMAVYFIGATVIAMMAFLRVLTYIYTWLNNYKSGHLVLLLAVGLAGPLGGLALNKEFPFPYDFQSLSVYLLAVANGLILLISFKQGTKREILGWFLRCLMYPFTLYFFIVFLPFLPLSLIAMIALGSGFLILAPTALFIVHTRKIAEEGMRITQTLGSKSTVLLFVIGFAIIPGVLFMEALRDRQSLMQAVDAVYNPDYTAKTISINPNSVERCLLKLRDMKNGIFLPFISSSYNQVVFGGMVLPDYKMEEMYRMFFGRQMPEAKFAGRFNFWGSDNSRNRTVAMPERNVQISDIAIQQTQEGEFCKAQIQLELTNLGSRLSEFVTEIQLDEGVMVSGYWLKIGDEKVPGKLFEKKAAMWIYHMIRDMSRRDPGLLVYQSDNTLKLSVFPFALNEKRLTGIELLYPTGMKPSIKIGDNDRKTLEDTGASAQDVLTAKLNPDQTCAVIPEKILDGLPHIQRKPYLHFIVDCSMTAKEAFASYAKRMAQIAATYGHASQCRITLANYDTQSLTESPATIDQIESIMNNAASKSIEFKGAFCYPRAIQQALLDFHARSIADSDFEFDVPIFIVISSPDNTVVSIGPMAAFEKLVPDIAYFYLSTADAGLSARPLDNPNTSQQEPVMTEIMEPAPVVVLRSGGSQVCVDTSGWGFAVFSDSKSSTVEYCDANAKKWLPVQNIKPLGGDMPYVKGLAVWESYRQTIFSPFTLTDRLPEIVKASRDCGIMTPLTSYIVLENSAQLEMLKRKEKQGLNANQALEFDEFMESPAPSALLLIPVAIVLLAKIRRNQKSN